MSHRGGGGAQSKASKTEKKGEDEGEKGKGRETTPLVTTEIVPGRLNESEWSLLLDRDEGQDFAAEVVAEVVDTVLGITYDSYLDIAVIPYTVDHFHVLLEEIIEAQFPICDVGEPILPSPDVDVIISHPEFPYPIGEEEDGEEAAPAAEVEDAAAAAAESSTAAAETAAAAAVIETEGVEVVVMDSTEDADAPPNPDGDDADPTAAPPFEAIASRSASAQSRVGGVGGVGSVAPPAAGVGDVSWMEDEEPVCGITDSWAQGSVPVQKTGQGSRPLSRISVVLEEEDAGMDEGLQEGAETGRRTGTPLGQAGKDEDDLRDADISQTVVPSEDKPKRCPWERSSKKQVPVKIKKKDPAYSEASEGAEGMKAPLDAAFLSSTTSILSLEAPLLPRYSGAVVRTQHGRPPGNKDIAYDELGNVIGVARIDPDKIPSHKVKTKFHVASDQEMVDSITVSPRRRLGSLKAARLPSIASSKALPTPPSIPPMPTIDDIVFPLATSQVGITPSDTFDRPSQTMIDRIDVSPGVIVRDNDRVKIGPEMPSPDTSAFTRLSDRGSMQPIKTHLPSPLAIKDMVERRTPTLRPYHEKSQFTHYGRAK